MKHYPPDEYQHCLEVARRYTNGDTDPIHRLLMEQRCSAQEAAYQKGFQEGHAAGVKKEHDRLLDNDWNEATLGQMRELIAAEKFYRPLIQAAALLEKSPAQACALIRAWNQEQTARDQEFEQFMQEIECQEP